METGRAAQDKQKDEFIIIEQIRNALDGLEYGSVNIIVHNGQVTQIDRLEKRRFSAVPTLRTSY